MSTENAALLQRALDAERAGCLLLASLLRLPLRPRLWRRCDGRGVRQEHREAHHASGPHGRGGRRTAAEVAEQGHEGRQGQRH